MSIKAMKQALGALISAEVELDCEYGATEILRQAIAEAEKQEQGEPVAWMRSEGVGSPIVTEELCQKYPEYRLFFTVPLYTTPQQRKPLTDEQTRKVAKLFSDRIAGECNVDKEDHWKYHSDQVIDDIKFVLTAAHSIKE